MKKYLYCILRYKEYIAAIILCAVIGVVAQLAGPALAGLAIDNMLAGTAAIPISIAAIIFLYAAAAAAGSAAQWVISTLSGRICAYTARDLRDTAIKKVQALPLSYLDAHQSGDILSRITADAEAFADGLQLAFTQFFTGILTIAGTLGFMLVSNLWIGLAVVLVTPLSLAASAFITRRCYKYFARQTQTRGALTAFASEMIEGGDTVTAFAQEQNSFIRFCELDSNFSDASLKATFFGSLPNPVTRFVNGVVYAVVTLAGALTSGFSIGQLSCFLNYASQYTKPFNEISGVIAELGNAFACARRLFELLDEPEEPPDNSGVISAGDVELNDVSFSYTPGGKLVRGLNLSAAAGERIAIVGPTGCGKTTLINLLMRFYDADSGSIRIDGHDIRDVGRASLRGCWGMVLQDTWLMDGTVRDNIAYGKPEATDEEVESAAKAAFADSFIRKLPDGYKTVLSNDGGELSQGQKQLLCIARVILRMPPMLILDEATSDIDTRTEVKIQAAIATLCKGRTSFIIAHRLSTIRDADRILVMRDGGIAEQGKHKELLEKGGLYSELYESQFDPIKSQM